MSTKTLSDTPTCFEKRTPARIQPSATIAKGGTDWREIVGEALRRMTLADMLRLALDALTAKYREELFLQDVQNLNSGETAWVLDIPVVAVQSRLR